MKKPVIGKMRLVRIEREARKKLIIDTIGAYVAQSGFSPSVVELAETLDLPHQSVARYVKQLIDGGYLTHTPGMHRTYKVLRPYEPKEISQ